MFDKNADLEANNKKGIKMCKTVLVNMRKIIKIFKNFH